MIVVDTSVWIDHLRSGVPALSLLLDQRLVLSHPWVVGELALGGVRSEHETLSLMGGLPQAVVATHAEVMLAIGAKRLSGAGIGYVDAQLLAATLLSHGARLWTNDRRLRAVASGLDCGFDADRAPDWSSD